MTKKESAHALALIHHEENWKPLGFISSRLWVSASEPIGSWVRGEE
ncbi:hypothetical protein [Vibrio nigripulchritudo]|nr:hypothetical protein [Vibrio nigripulchritudo]